MSKKSKHARNQAKYMQRKRDAGLEWLTEWVPEPALGAFKTIAKATRKSHTTPDPTRLAAAEALAEGGSALPDWARGSDILLSVWLLSRTAAGALEQVQAEREASKSGKGQTPVAAEGEAAPIAAPEAVTDMEIKAAPPPVPEPPTPELATPAPVRRPRRKATAAAPPDTAG